jgi:hypothetical protein
MSVEVCTQALVRDEHCYAEWQRLESTRHRLIAEGALVLAGVVHPALHDVANQVAAYFRELGEWERMIEVEN